MRGRKLTERQRRFVDEYVLGGNATQAAIRAGFKERSARVQGARLIANAAIALAIRRKREAASKRIEITADKVLQRYAQVAFGPEPKETRASDQLEALKWLGKHLGLFVERHEHDIGARLGDALNKIKAQLSPAAQEELVRAVGSILAQNVAPRTDEPASEPSSAPSSR